MKSKKIISALQYVEQGLLEEAMTDPTSVEKNSHFRFGALIAACLCLICSMTAFWFLLNEKTGTPGRPEVVVTTGSPMEEATDDWPGNTDFRVALIVEGFFYGSNQSVYTAYEQWCEAYGEEVVCYKAPGESPEGRMSAIEQAVVDGNTVLILNGENFADAVIEMAAVHPEIYYIALEVNASDLGEDDLIPPNVYCVSYQEEIAGFMAGVAAVKLGYTKLGFLGDMAETNTMRYGYGFVQGADYAAGLTGTSVEMKYCYSNYHYSDPAITAYMDTWYAEGTEVVFACGGEIYFSVAEAAQKVGGKVIGSDVDLQHTIDGMFGEGLILTSATKKYDTTIGTILSQLYIGNWDIYGGEHDRLGLISETGPFLNLVQLSDATQFGEGFTQEDYELLIAELLNGDITVSSDIENKPVTNNITVEYQDNIME